MTEKRALAKKNIENILKNIPYKYYNDNKLVGGNPRCGKSIISELRQKNLNCSDIAPHQKEIDILTQMGFTPKQIIKILYGDMK